MSTPQIELHLEEDVLDDLQFLAKHAAKIEPIVNVAGQLPSGAGLVESANHAARHVQLPVREAKRLLLILQIFCGRSCAPASTPPSSWRSPRGPSRRRRTSRSGANSLMAWKDAVDSIREQLAKIDGVHPFAVARKAEVVVRPHEGGEEAQDVNDLWDRAISSWFPIVHVSEEEWPAERARTRCACCTAAWR